MSNEVKRNAGQPKEAFRPGTPESFEVLLDLANNCQNSLEVLHAKAMTNAEALEFFKLRAHDFSERLIDLARSGVPGAVRLLSDQALRLTTVINEIGRDHPDMISPFARHQLVWPRLGSPRPNFAGAPPDYEKLQVGEAFPVRMDKRARSLIDDPIGQIAWALLSHLLMGRDRGIQRGAKNGTICQPCLESLNLQGKDRIAVRSDYCSLCSFRLLSGEAVGGKFCRLCAPNVEYLVNRPPQQAHGMCKVCKFRALPPGKRDEHRKQLDLDRQVSLLPEFQTDSASVWWDVAAACLIKGYPHPEEKGELNGASPLLNSLLTDHARRKSEKQRRSAILRTISERFADFAPKIP